MWGEAVNHPRPNTAFSQSLLNPWKTTHCTPELQPLRRAQGPHRERGGEVGIEAESGEGRKDVSLNVRLILQLSSNLQRFFIMLIMVTF